HVTTADDREWHHRETSLKREEKAAALEARDATITTARSLGEDDQRQTIRRQACCPPEDLRAIGMAPVDQHVTSAPQMPAEKRKVAERLLRDDAKLKRQRPEQDRNAVDALMIRDEDVRATGHEPIESLDTDAHARRHEDES